VKLQKRGSRLPQKKNSIKGVSEEKKREASPTSMEGWTNQQVLTLEWVAQGTRSIRLRKLHACNGGEKAALRYMGRMARKGGRSRLGTRGKLLRRNHQNDLGNTE